MNASRGAVEAVAGAAEAAPGKLAHSIIDCDLHPIMNSLDQMAPYLSSAWREGLNLGKGTLAPGQVPYSMPRGPYFNQHGGYRTDARSERAGLPGSDPPVMVRQVFREAGSGFG